MPETFHLHRGVAAFRAAVVESAPVEASGPLSPEALLAARVDQELDRCAGLMFTATPTEDLVEVARWQRLQDRSWAGQVRAVVAATCRMSTDERDFAGDEMALSLGISPDAGRQMVWHYGELASLPGLLESVESDRLSRAHVEAFVRELNETGLTAEQRQAAVLISLARWNGQTPGDWARMLRRLALTIDPAASKRRKDERTAGRRVAFYPRPDEQGGMWLEAPLEQVAAAHARIDAEARRLKAAGDERTMDQLRCDITLELLTLGTIDGQDAADWTVAVVVPVSVLEGGDIEVAEIPGFGPILPSTARDLAAQASRFEQIAVDENGEVIALSDQRTLTPEHQTGPATEPTTPVEPTPEPASPGPCLLGLIRRARQAPVLRDLSSDSYRPSTRLSRFVQVRDRRCCFPGCTRPAARTDKDHLDPWPHGRTRPENVHCLCRHHHRAKHTVFTVLKDPDGSTIWITRGQWWFTRPPQGY